LIYVGLLLEGIVIGFAIAAPVGPIGVLCIRRTLADGRTSGLVSGLGAATADALYGSVAALGLTFVADLLMGGESWLRLVGGAFLVFLGVRTFLVPPAEQAAPAGRSGLLGAYASTLLLTLTNPTTILSFAAIFAGLGAGDANGDAVSAMSLVLGVFLGSATWWFVLSGATGLFRARLSSHGLRWVNRISGTVVTIFGVLAVSGLGG
jgi:threonine/homoserine/homoserine lactone efflux protein